MMSINMATIEVQEQQQVMETKRMQSKELPWHGIVEFYVFWFLNLEGWKFEMVGIWWNHMKCFFLGAGELYKDLLVTVYICSLVCIWYTKMLSKGCMRRWEKWEDFEPDFQSKYGLCFFLENERRNGCWQKISPGTWKRKWLTEASRFSFQPFVFWEMFVFFLSTSNISHLQDLPADERLMNLSLRLYEHHMVACPRWGETGSKPPPFPALVVGRWGFQRSS